MLRAVAAVLALLAVCAAGAAANHAGSRRPLLAPQAGTISPGAIPGIAFWYDPSKAANVTLNGADVSALVDVSANSRNATQGTAAQQPLYNTSAGINALGSVLFTGANNDALLVQSALAMTNNVAGHSIGAVVRVTSLAAISAIYFNYINVGTIARFQLRANVTTGKPQLSTRRLDGDTTYSFVAGGAFQLNVPQSIVASVDYTTGVVMILLNGTVFTGSAVGTWSGVGNTSATNSGVAPTLGRVAASVFNSDMGEIAGYGRALTVSEMRGLAAYYRGKWGSP